MRTAELDYELPHELIAQHPCPERDGARMLVLDRATRTYHEDVFRNMPHYLRAGDCAVLNNTRVIRARLLGRKPSGGVVELFLLHEDGPGDWRALVRPSSRVRPGTPVRLASGLEATVGEVLAEGRRRVAFNRPDVLETLEAVGEVPLPPYIHRDAPDPNDPTRYQTVYAAIPGAVAAPTAGLHFTAEVLAALEAVGVQRAFLTLHVGYGTFKPVTAEDLAAHTVDPESFTLPEATAATLNATRARGGRVVAVGTTTTRVLETQYRDGAYHPGIGTTDRYIHPPYQFAGVDVLQTNFHLPRSSLLALVCAFAGVEFILEAYRHAIERRFRFYSYGDVMLIL
ncbi:MAG TPA: tRNA preQ1(34) S-adenosylmethionine ribosyltransferase-isomerase QueA [Candidatus Hydrogenedentes bacterium]|nr:tRNA preQ1(34) S-adenosylmethionine ribosyltransferase-isomerase QueA [Candidatus Hydrogenedentota bacterium]HNT86974.1 tRNA preQ1(34) S-adenosylmethionine ribosyltransferase-isomerase QueA [Candidatus Hydrogenedentota bacterium]